jgi:hypothetical protein
MTENNSNTANAYDTLARLYPDSDDRTEALQGFTSADLDLAEATKEDS